MSTRAKAEYGCQPGQRHHTCMALMREMNIKRLASILAKGDHLWKFMTVGVML